MLRVVREFLVLFENYAGLQRFEIVCHPASFRMLFHIQFASSCFCMTPLCCLTCFVTLFSFQGAGLQPLLQSDLKIRPFSQVFPKANRLVGPSGLEPPTLRLSVVRSSQLSYGPSSSQSPLAAVSGFAENFSRSLAPPLRFKPASLGFETIGLRGLRLVTLILLVEIVGFEPATSCLQGRRSPS